MLESILKITVVILIWIGWGYITQHWYNNKK